MVRKIMIAALAASALAVTGAAAAAKPGKGKGPKVERVAKTERGIGAQGSAMRAKGRLNSKGPLNASPRGIERSSANSVLKGSTVIAGPLTGLDPGDPVFATVDGSLEEIGTVRRIVPGKGGRVSNVLVRSTDGRTLPISPDSLTLDPATDQWTAGRLRGGSE